MAKEPTVISIDTLLKRAQEARLTYGSGAEITIDEDLVISPYNQPDLAEETPEQSAKRAERQQKEIRDEPGEHRLTVPVEALQPAKPAQVLSERKEATPSKS